MKTKYPARGSSFEGPRAGETRAQFQKRWDAHRAQLEAGWASLRSPVTVRWDCPKCHADHAVYFCEETSTFDAQGSVER